jgi:glyoxylase-like metal-dependent hydrolase (beta-lactamase superfamily II)
MVTQIIDGLYQLKVPIPDSALVATNIYLLKGDKGYTLIDTGWGGERAFNSLKGQLAEIGVGLSEISQLVVTHVHFDHYGLAGKIKKSSNARIYVHRREQEIFHTRYAVTEESLNRIEQWLQMNGVPAELTKAVHKPIGGFGKPIPAQPDVLLEGDEVIPCGYFNLKVIWTPGHTPGHICLYEPTHKLLFTGDHILPVITPNVGLAAYSEANPLGDYLKSLAHVKKLAVETVLPAHENVFSDLSKRVDEITHHHELRSAEIVNVMQRDELTAYQTANLVVWVPEHGGVKYADLSAVAKIAAISETLAHLRALNIRGKVINNHRNDIVYYRII